MGSPIIFSGSNAKLLKENLDYGSHFTHKTGSFSAANNQSAAANVTGLAFDSATERGGRVVVTVFIDATSNYAAIFEIDVMRTATSVWEASVSYLGEATGIIFSVSTSGQIQYTSTNLGGFVSNTMRWSQSILKN